MSESKRTSLFMVLCYLLAAWRDDPDRLGVAVTAYRLRGWHMEHYEVAEGYRAGKPHLSDADARELIHRALYRRNRRRLRQRAEGLLMALDAFAVDVERMRLHDQRVESAVIECRFLSLDERIAKLRAMDAAL